MLKNLAFAAAVFAQVATITYLYAEPAWTMTHGDVLTLQTKPVDPYDMFRGEYAQLGYDFEQPAPAHLHLQPDQVVYAVLSKTKSNWKLVNYSTTKPIPAAGQIVLRGHADSPWSAASRGSSFGDHGVNFGIERLYLPEGQSRDLQFRGKSLKVEVAVNTAGQALIKRVFDGDKLIYDGTKVTLGF